MKEILNDIYTWPWFSEPHGYHFNGYLIRHAAGNLCIDPVEPDEATLDKIIRLGVARILLTNRNHVRAAHRIQGYTQARTAIHPADAAHARDQGANLDEALRVGETIGPLTVIGVPGKSPGEVALYWPTRSVLIVGDCVIGNPPGRLSLLPDKVIDDPAQLRRSVRQLLDLAFDILLTGDGEPLLHDASARLRDLVETFPKA